MHRCTIGALLAALVLVISSAPAARGEPNQTTLTVAVITSRSVFGDVPAPVLHGLASEE